MLSEPDMVVEGEFYAHGFTFPEIQHFFSSADVEAPHKRRELELLWGKTNGGTRSYSATEKGRIVEESFSFWIPTYSDVDVSLLKSMLMSKAQHTQYSFP